MKHLASFVVFVIFAITAAAAPPSGIFPKDLQGQELTWQARVSMRLAAECTGNKCDEYAVEPGTVYLLGVAYFYGESTVYLIFFDSCELDGELCVEPGSFQAKVIASLYEVTLLWNADAGAYLRVLETSPDTADFDALTMTDVDAGYLQIGAFDIKADKVHRYSKDVTREVWSLEKWWPELPPSNEPN